MQEKSIIETITTLLTDKVKTSEKEQAQAKLAGHKLQVDYDAFQTEPRPMGYMGKKHLKLFIKTAVDAGKYLSLGGTTHATIIVNQTYQKDYESAPPEMQLKKSCFRQIYYYQ